MKKVILLLQACAACTAFYLSMACADNSRAYTPPPPPVTRARDTTVHSAAQSMPRVQKLPVKIDQTSFNKLPSNLQRMLKGYFHDDGKYSTIKIVATKVPGTLSSREIIASTTLEVTVLEQGSGKVAVEELSAAKARGTTTSRVNQWEHAGVVNSLNADLQKIADQNAVNDLIRRLDGRREQIGKEPVKYRTGAPKKKSSSFQY